MQNPAVEVLVFILSTYTEIMQDWIKSHHLKALPNGAFYDTPGMKTLPCYQDWTKESWHQLRFQIEAATWTLRETEKVDDESVQKARAKLTEVANIVCNFFVGSTAHTDKFIVE